MSKLQPHETHRALVGAALDALPPPLHVKAICKGCPHPAECKGKPCLNDIARPLLEANAFSRLMLPAQARGVEAALREGKSLQTITSSLVRHGAAVCTPSKFKYHCAAYPAWGAEMKALADTNSRFNKGKGRRGGTHCQRGHELPTEPNALRYGKPYTKCSICQKMAWDRGHIPNEEIIGRVMVQLLLKRPISSFTAGGSLGFITSHKNFIAMCRAYPEIDALRLAVIESHRAKPKVKKARKVRARKLPSDDRSNLQARLTGVIAAQPDPIHSATEAALPRNLPSEMRRVIVNDMWVAVKEGAIALDDLPKAVNDFKASYNRVFPSKYAPPSVDAPAFREGATPLIEAISESEGLWA
ncbi:hypothetical protein [Rhodopseudomonas sp. RCAM05734]|uniref:hypothetical protein n=1 Tax=Rhodopseudomonas sp. RCAM05734 TaxID=3457549 RepID=UPI004043D02D